MVKRRLGLLPSPWAWVDPDPSGRHPGHEHVRQPRPEHRSGAVRRRMGARPTLDVLGGAAHRRSAWRTPLSLAQRGTVRSGHRSGARKIGEVDPHATFDSHVMTLEHTDRVNAGAKMSTGDLNETSLP